MRKFLFLLILLFTFSIAQAQEAQTFLWKVEKGGKTSYLVGTLHIGRNATLSRPLERALNECDYLITETELLNIDETEVLQISMQMLDLSGNLTDKLGASHAAKVAQITGYPEEVLDTLKPWGIYTMMMYNIPQGYSEQYGIDLLLSQKAEALGKTRIGLEGTLESMAFISNIPESKLIPMIRYMADNTALLKAETKRVADYYFANNVTKLLAEFDATNDKSLYPKGDADFWISWYMDDLLAKRTQNWLPIIEAQMAKGRTLVAVGAAHLYYDIGLIKQLEKRGYKLTPVLK